MTDEPWSHVEDPDYFKEIMKNVVHYGGPVAGNASTVRFGMTGKGIRPNYQISYGDKKVAIASVNHKPDSSSPEEYDDEKLSNKASLTKIYSVF